VVFFLFHARLPYSFPSLGIKSFVGSRNFLGVGGRQSKAPSLWIITFHQPLLLFYLCTKFLHSRVCLWIITIRLAYIPFLVYSGAVPPPSDAFGRPRKICYQNDYREWKFRKICWRLHMICLQLDPHNPNFSLSKTEKNRISLFVRRIFDAQKLGGEFGYRLYGLGLYLQVTVKQETTFKANWLDCVHVQENFNSDVTLIPPLLPTLWPVWIHWTLIGLQQKVFAYINVAGLASV